MNIQMIFVVVWARVLHMSCRHRWEGHERYVGASKCVGLPPWHCTRRAKRDQHQRTRSGSRSRCGHVSQASRARQKTQPLFSTFHLQSLFGTCTKILPAARWRCAHAVCEHIERGLRLLSHRKMFRLRFQRTCHPRGQNFVPVFLFRLFVRLLASHFLMTTCRSTHHQSARVSYTLTVVETFHHVGTGFLHHMTTTSTTSSTC